MKSKIVPIAVSVVCLIAGILTGTVLTGGYVEENSNSALKNDVVTLTPVSVDEYAAEVVDY